MRGGCLHILAIAVSLFSACAGRGAAPESPARPSGPPPDEGSRASEQPAVYRFPAAGTPPADAVKGGGGEVPVKAEAPPKPASGPDDVLRLQKEAVERNPSRDDEKLRLALLYAAAGNLEEAERTLSSLRSRSDRLVPFIEFFLRRELGDHKEAKKLLDRFAEADKRATGFLIERAELCSRIGRFREFVPAENDRVRPGGKALLYVEPRNFTLSREGERHLLHLRYEWRLYDDRSAEVPVPAWEKARPVDREDRIALNGPVEEFHQSFTLPLPDSLAAGSYRIRVTVTDVPSGKSDRIYVPISVAAPEKER